MTFVKSYIMPSLSIRLMGTFEVTRHRQIINQFESDETRALLAYLAVEASQAHRRERLAGMLWPASTEKAARTNLRHILSNLRHVIGDRQVTPPFLEITRQTIQFKQNQQSDVDITRFLALTAPQNPPNPQWLADAIALYRGPFLDGFSLPDSVGFEEWLLVTREQLTRQMLGALTDLTDYYEAQCHYQQALPYAWRRVSLDPWREDAYQCLMRLLAKTGQRSLALVQFETCRRVLTNELGVEPAPETMALYDHILAGTLDAPSVQYPEDALRASLAKPTTTPPPHNLPRLLTSFVGRESEIATLRQRLVDPDCRLLSLIGLGGAGKTRLSLAVAQTFLDVEDEQSSFADGVYIVSLADLEHPDELVAAIADAIGFHFQAEIDLQTQLQAYLSNKKILLILDNFEHLLTRSLVISELLLAAPDLRILVTARTALDLHEEWLYPVTGLALPPSEQQDETKADLAKPISAYSAIHLFEQRAKQVQPYFNLTDEAPWVLYICQRLEGIPLGIELAAAMTHTLPCQTIAQEMDQTFTFLATSQRNIPHRQRSLQAVFEHSWQLLSDLEQQTLARLAVFPADFTQQAAKAITESPLVIVNDLVEKSLLQVQSSGRYHLHALMKEFVLERLTSNGAEGAETFTRHSEFYLAWLRPLLPKLQGPNSLAASKQVVVDYENARQAVSWALEQGMMTGVETALDTLFFFLMQQGRYPEGQRLCTLIAQATSAASTPSERQVKIKGEIWDGFFRHRLGDVAGARQRLQAGLDQLSDVNLPVANATTLEAQATFFLAELKFDSDRAKTKALFDRSLQLYRLSGNQWGEAKVLLSLGWFAKFTGQMEEAKCAFEKALALSRTLGNNAAQAEALSSLAHHLIAISPDSFETAEAYAQESLRLHQAHNHQPQIAQALSDVGEVCMWGGQFEDAERYFRQSIDVYQTLGMADNDLATRQMSLGFIKMHLGDYQAALKQAAVSLKMAERFQNQFVLAFSYQTTARGDC